MTDIIFGAIILAGGKSSRMGYPKPWLTDSDGHTFLGKLVRTYKEAGCKQVVVVINNSFCDSRWSEQLKEVSNEAVLVPNTQVDKGRFYSIKLAVDHLDSSDFVFLQNVDNPFVDQPLLKILKESRVESGCTVPSFNTRGGHPILLSDEIIKQIAKLKDDTLNLRDILSLFQKKYIAVPWKQVLANINTPATYQTYLKNERID